MIGPHDLGGARGHGPVRPEANEPVFHAPWEATMFALNILAGNWTPPEFRSVIEQMPPEEYLATSYYEHWLFQFERFFAAKGVFTQEEIEQLVASPRVPGNRPEGANPIRRDDVAPMLLKGGVNRAAVDKAPRFAVGDQVRMSRDNPATHTRLPGYLRGCIGRIAALHGGFFLSDAQAQGRYDEAEYLYTVRFEGSEVWGRSAEAGCALHADLFESYMEPA